MVYLEYHVSTFLRPTVWGEVVNFTAFKFLSHLLIEIDKKNSGELPDNVIGIEE